MTRYRLDGTVVDTANATAHWLEAKVFDGHNMVSKATGDQFLHETLYRSKKGRYYVEYHSQWVGSRDHVEWVSPQEAARWLLANDHELPEDLEKYEEEVME